MSLLKYVCNVFIIEDICLSEKHYDIFEYFSFLPKIQGVNATEKLQQSQFLPYIHASGNGKIYTDEIRVRKGSNCYPQTVLCNKNQLRYQRSQLSDLLLPFFNKNLS